MKKIHISIVILWLSLTANAQQMLEISGVIRDNVRREPVPYVHLVVNKSAADAGPDGTFVLRVPVSDVYALEAMQLGFEPLRMTLSALPADALELWLTPRPVWMSELLITGARVPELAQATTLVDNSEQAVRSRDIGELLNTLPGFAIIKRGGYALDPVFRGFKYEQLNVVYDGGTVLTHACPNRMDPTTTHINPQDIQKIELIRGPFSMRYGTSAGATINIVTENPFQQGKTGFGGSADAGYTFNGDGKTARMSLYQQGDRTYVAASGGFKDYGDYRSGSGVVVPSSFRSWDYDIKAGMRAGAQQQWMATWRQGFARDVVHVGLMMDTDYDNSSIATLDYKWSNAGSTLHELNVKGYYSFVDHQMSNTNRPSFQSSGAVANVTATTLGGRAEATLLQDARQRWFVGSDLRYTGRSGSRVRTQKLNMATGEPLPKPLVFRDTIWPDAEVGDVGVFLEGRRLIGEAFTLLAGVRSDMVWANASLAESDFRKVYGADLSPKPTLLWSGTMALAWQVSAQSSWQLALGRGVRPANMIERYINHFNVGTDPYEYVGNPFLKAEANHQVELSWNRKSAVWDFSAQVFYAYIDEYISAVVDSTLKRKFMPMSQPRVSRRFVNLDAAVQTGWETQVGWQFAKNWYLATSLAYTYGKNTTSGNPLPEIAPLESTQRLKWSPGSWWVEVRSRVVGRQQRVSPEFAEPMTDGFHTLDIQAGARLFSSLQLGASVTNLFDVTYRKHLNRAYVNWTEPGVILEPGRNIHLSLNYSF